MRAIKTLLLLALCAGMLVPGLAGGQSETPLDVCLDGKREWAARVDPCRTAAEQGDAGAQFRLGPVNTNDGNMLYIGDGTDSSPVRPYCAVPSGAAG